MKLRQSKTNQKRTNGVQRPASFPAVRESHRPAARVFPIALGYLD